LILQVIEEAAGDRRLAARRLGIGLTTLYRKLEEFEAIQSGAGRADDVSQAAAATDPL